MRPWLSAALAMPPIVSAAGYVLAPVEAWRVVSGIAFLACLAVTLAVVGVVHARGVRRRAREIAPEATRRRAELAGPAPEGVVYVEGVVSAASEPLVAPLSGDACLFYEVVTERLGKHADGEWSWSVVEREARGSRFLLVDDAGSLEVEAPEAHADFAPPHVFEIVNPDHQGVRAWRAIHEATAVDVLRACGGELRYLERRLKRGDRMRVEGSARPRADGSWTFIPRAAREPLMSSLDDPLADEPIESRMTSPNAALLEGGLLVALAAVIFTWAVLSAFHFAVDGGHAATTVASLGSP